MISIRPIRTRQPLSDHSKSDHREMMVERICETNARTLHDHEACGVDRRQFVQVGAAEVAPRFLQITQITGKNLDSSRLVDRLLPRKRHVAVGIAIEKRERLNDDRNGRVKPGARSAQRVP